MSASKRIMFARKHEIPHMGDAGNVILAIQANKVKKTVEVFFIFVGVAKSEEGNLCKKAEAR